MEIMAYVAFGIYVLVILTSGLVAVRAKNLVRALMGLIGTLFGVAGMYLLMTTPFLAFMQILIYIGAVCVLTFFAIMMTRADETGEESKSVPFSRKLLGASALMIPGLAIAQVVITHPPLSIATPVETPLAELGRGLLEDYVLVFILISLVLTVAMSGAVLLTWQKKDKL